MRYELLVGVVLVVTAGCGRGPFRDIAELQRRCDAVDFLFAIDNSQSMEPHQENLRVNFGPFVDGIAATLDEVDSYHVGVVTSGIPTANPESCRELGALVTRASDPRGPRDCRPFAEGRPFMTEADDLDPGFNCVADVGTHGGRDEAPMRALTLAAGGATARPWYGECVGRDFIRDDALLVAVIVTDEEDGDEMGTGSPTEWFDSIVHVKGREENAVVVSLVNGADTGCEAADARFDGRNIANFTHRFTHGYVEGICQPDYRPIFDTATAAVEEACDEYVTVRENVGE